jgi:predicted DNA-binding protein YlxM (UPF0122 family)
MTKQQISWQQLEYNFRILDHIVYGPEAIRIRGNPEWKLEGMSRKAKLHFQNTAVQAAVALQADKENHANISDEAFRPKCPLDVWLTAVRLTTQGYVRLGGHYELDPSAYKIDPLAMGKIPQVAYWSAELCHLLDTMTVRYSPVTNMNQAATVIPERQKGEISAPAAVPDPVSADPSEDLKPAKAKIRKPSPKEFEGLGKIEPGQGLKEWGHLFTKKQFDIYHMIVDHRLPIAEVARRHGITRPSVDKQFAACRRKIENYIENNKSKASKLADILLKEKIKREKWY